MGNQNIKELKIGIITDTHGNFPALNAILQELRERHCDEIIHLGDVICMCGQSRECMDTLLKEPNTTLIMGNHDRDYLYNYYEQTYKSHITPEHRRFIFSQLGDKYKSCVSEFKMLEIRNIFGVRFAFVHYAPVVGADAKARFAFLPIDIAPTGEKFDRMFSSVDADVVFFGHHHTPCDITSKRVYVDVGSVGCHADGNARGIILTSRADGTYNYERVSRQYDISSTIDNMLTLGVPNAEDILTHYFHIDINTK
ncbi:MAG: metallophosphoesterase family protein [Clostridia bacterium]